MDVSKSFFLSVKRSFEEFCFFETFLPTDVKLGRVEIIFFLLKLRRCLSPFPPFHRFKIDSRSGMASRFRRETNHYKVKNGMARNVILIILDFPR